MREASLVVFCIMHYVLSVVISLYCNSCNLKFSESAVSDIVNIKLSVKQKKRKKHMKIT